MPELLLPSLATVLLLASVIPTYLGDEAIKKDDQRGLQRNLILEIVLEVAFITLIGVHLFRLNYRWQDNAYASIYYMLVITHLAFAATMVLENAYVLIQAYRGFYNSERHWGVEVDGLSSYFVVAVWIAVFITVYLSPYLIQ